jgi:hypothetical protein
LNDKEIRKRIVRRVVVGGKEERRGGGGGRWKGVGDDCEVDVSEKGLIEYVIV